MAAQVPSARSSSPLPKTHRSSSRSSEIYLPQGPEALIYPEGAVGEEATDLLGEFVHVHHSEATLVEDDGENIRKPTRGGDDFSERPWYKRPSAVWLLCLMPFTAIAMASTIAPRVELYTRLACREHKPEYSAGRGPSSSNYLTTNGYPHGIHVDANISERASQISTLPYMSLAALGSFPIATQPFYRDMPEDPTHNQTSADKERERQLCASDPEVQAHVAKLMASMATVSGILTCLTTAWWGSLSDRHGRMRVVGISVFGTILADLNLIFVSWFSTKLPGGYWFLIVGPTIEGILGGTASSIAAMHAYVADCTEPSARSRIFSMSLGLMFTGFAIGPTFGGFLIHVTETVLSVFYFATFAHVLFAFVVWVVIPESLSRRSMQESRQRRVAELAEALDAERAEAEAGRSTGICLLMRFKRLFGFLSPLTVFAPKSLDKDNAPGKRRAKDWSLTFLVLSLGFNILIMSSYSYKFQYAAATFGWSSEVMSYWLSLIGVSRALYLAIILPITIKLFMAARKPAIQLPIEPAEPLHPSQSAAAQDTPAPDAAQSQPTKAQTTPAKKTPHSPTFDLNLARFSLVIEVVCYTLIPLGPSPLTFTVFSMLASFSGGFNPAAQSLALVLFARSGETETGRLFGALSVVQAMCQQILGPAIFGLTYMKTVATYPKTIFFLSASCATVSLLFISLVRLPKDSPPVPQDPEVAHPPSVDREQTLVHIDE
ncbi:MFS general substrate transporter [Rickenella mellea]|uniref:MFS general substrate transporter n=1 Tax=Rickenella mellea TaxID=50990 RepID=A0A4Y7QCL8_9AGAM|nr:MFS general substrate transporter [Rickenella mellea]